MKLAIAVALVFAFTSAAFAQTQCYWVNGKQTCCTRIGNQTFCN